MPWPLASGSLHKYINNSMGKTCANLSYITAIVSGNIIPKAGVRVDGADRWGHYTATGCVNSCHPVANAITIA